MSEPIQQIRLILMNVRGERTIEAVNPTLRALGKTLKSKLLIFSQSTH